MYLIKGVKEVWALVSPHSTNSEHQLAKFCIRVVTQVNIVEIDKNPHAQWKKLHQQTLNIIRINTNKNV